MNIHRHGIKLMQIDIGFKGNFGNYAEIYEFCCVVNFVCVYFWQFI